MRWFTRVAARMRGQRDDRVLHPRAARARGRDLRGRARRGTGARSASETAPSRATICSTPGASDAGNATPARGSSPKRIGLAWSETKKPLTSSAGCVAHQPTTPTFCPAAEARFQTAGTARESPEIGTFAPVFGSTSWKSRTRWTSGPTPVAAVVQRIGESSGIEAREVRRGTLRGEALPVRHPALAREPVEELPVEAVQTEPDDAGAVRRPAAAERAATSASSTGVAERRTRPARFPAEAPRGVLRRAGRPQRGESERERAENSGAARTHLQRSGESYRAAGFDAGGAGSARAGGSFPSQYASKSSGSPETKFPSWRNAGVPERPRRIASRTSRRTRSRARPLESSLSNFSCRAGGLGDVGRELRATAARVQPLAGEERVLVLRVERRIDTFASAAAVLGGGERPVVDLRQRQKPHLDRSALLRRRPS